MARNMLAAVAFKDDSALVTESEMLVTVGRIRDFGSNGAQEQRET